MSSSQQGAGFRGSKRRAPGRSAAASGECGRECGDRLPGWGYKDIPTKEAGMARAEHSTFASPNEVRTFEKGRLELIKIGGGVVGRLTLEPGWRWSKHVKPIAGTEWCEAPHFQYQVSGKMHVKMTDGTEFDLGPGEVSALPQGHDAWVLGNEPVVVIDWAGASNYAKS
jgi:hypothetical protein